MAFFNLTDLVIAPAKRLAAETVRRLRDNLLAVVNGNRSAPRIIPSALKAYSHKFSVPVSFRGGITVQVPYTRRVNLGEGDFREEQTTRGQYLNPSQLTVATTTEFLPDPQAVWVAYVYADNLEFTGDSANLSGTPPPSMTIIDTNHSLSRFNSRVEFTVALANDPRANSASNAITGQVNCTAYYFRDHLWVPDANRSP